MPDLLTSSSVPDIDFDDMSWRGPNAANQHPQTKTAEGKMCPMCERFLPWDSFHKSSGASRAGRQSRCKECRSLAHKAISNPVSVTEKRCCRCGEVKPASEFHRNQRRKAGLTSICKWCVKVTESSKRYSLTTDEFIQMHTKADGVCALCHEVVGATNLNVDHHHGTGEVRGLLCSRCNTGLYLFDDPTLFARACAWTNSLQEVSA